MVPPNDVPGYSLRYKRTVANIRSFVVACQEQRRYTVE